MDFSNSRVGYFRHLDRTSDLILYKLWCITKFLLYITWPRHRKKRASKVDILTIGTDN